MSLLDDARRLLADRPIRGGSALKSHPSGRCYYCLGDGYGEPHAPDCPWLSMSKIVAALEAAEHVETAARRVQGHHPTTIKSGPYHDPPGAPIEMCMEYCSTWPCEVSTLLDAVDDLSEAIEGKEPA